MTLRNKIILSFLVLIWCLGIFIEFLIPFINSLAFVHPFLKNIYSNVCHQNQEKLLTFSSYSTFTCARCTGIYIGSLISSIFLIFFVISNELKFKYFVFAGIPMLLDVIFYHIGLYTYSKIVAFSTGILLGSIAFIYLYIGFQKLLSKVS